MADPVKIIIFQRNGSTEVHSNIPLSIMYFSKDDYIIDEENLILIQDEQWELDLGEDDIISSDEFELIWSQGINFITHRKEVQKAQRHEELETKIHEAKCKLEQLQREKEILSM